MIKKITIKDFGKCEYLSLNCSAKIIGIFGENGAGKSTIKNAIEFALTGLCRGIRQKKDMPEMIRRGAKQAIVKIETATGKTIERVLNASGQRIRVHDGENYIEDESAIEAIFGVSPEMLSLAFDSDNFMRLPPEKRLKFMQDVFESTATVDAIKKLLPEYGIPENFYDDNYLKINLETLDHIKASVVEARKAAKRELQAMPPIPAAPEKIILSGREVPVNLTQEQEANVRTRLAGNRNSKADLEKQIQFLQGSGSGKKEAIEKEIAELKAEAEECRETMKKEAQYLKDLKAVDACLQEAEKRIAEKETELNSSIGMETLIRSQLSKYPEKSASAKCPLFDVECKSASIIGEKTAEIKRQRDKISRELDEQKRKSDAIRTEKKMLEEDNIKNKHNRAMLSNLGLDIKIAKDKAEKIQAKINEKTNAAAQAEVSPEGLEALSKTLGIINEKIENAEKLLKAKDDYNAFMESSKKAADLKAKIDTYNNIDRAFSPDGIPARLIRPVFDKLKSMTAQTSHILAGFDVNPDCTFSADGTHESLLSESEKYRIGMMVQDAICRSIKIPFLICDRMDILVGSNRGAFLKAMKSLSENYSNIIFFAANTLDRIKPSPWEEMKFFFLSDGSLSEISAAAASTVAGK